MLIAVTGATGLIGGRLVQMLGARGHTVRALVRDTSRSKLAPEIETATWDLENGGEPSVLSGADTLVHAAAYMPRSWTDPSEASRCLHVNALGTLSLLEAAIVSGVRHVVYLSAGNAYRPGLHQAVEEDALYPSTRASYYLASKVCGEIYVDHAQQTGRLKVCVLRPSGVYGPGMRSQGLVPMLAARLQKGEKAIVQDGGRYQVDLVYVDDVVAAVIAAVERVATGIFNVGSGQVTTSADLARMLATLLKHDESLVEIVGASDGPPVVGFSALNIDRARRDLGYAPRPLRAGLAAYLESFQ